MGRSDRSFLRDRFRAEKSRSLQSVLNQTGNRYGLLYGLAEPNLPKNDFRVLGSGKAHWPGVVFESKTPSAQERKLLAFLLDRPVPRMALYEDLEHAPHFNVAVGASEFRQFQRLSIACDLRSPFIQFAKAIEGRDNRC